MADIKEKDTDKAVDGAKEKSPEEFENEIDNILAGMSQEEKHAIRRTMALSMQVGGTISPQMELMRKMTPEHVTSYLEGQREATELQFRENHENKIFFGVLLAFAMIFVIVIIILLKDNPDIMEKVLYAAGGVIAGAVGGYGYGKSKKDD